MLMLRYPRAAGLWAAVILVSLAAVARAGPLDPPTGPVASTHNTLSEIEPRTPTNAATAPGNASWLHIITQPGPYYLTGNLQGVAGKGGISIQASGVIVDLMGFEMAGVAGLGQGIGTTTQTNLGDITVRNGVVRGWQLGVVIARRSVAADLVITGCAGRGLHCAGQEPRVVRCTLVSNMGAGLSSSGSGLATNRLFSRNGGEGLRGAGDWIVEGCAAEYNRDHGIDVGNGSVVRGCNTFANTGDGISVGDRSLVLDNTCSANRNGTISVAGVRLRGASSRADGNVCHDNSLGIIAEGDGNRIEGNTCTDNGIGFDVDGVGNFVVRNIARGNSTSWAVVARNVILVVQAATAGIVVGNFGGLSPGSTNPNANYSY